MDRAKDIRDNDAGFDGMDFMRQQHVVKGNRRRLLLMTGDGDVRQQAEWHLAAELEIDLTFTEDPPSALRLLKSGVFDLMIVDLDAVTMEDDQACSHLNEVAVARAVPLIAMRTAANGWRDPASKLQAADYLRKPAALPDLVARVSLQLTLLDTLHALRRQVARVREESEAHAVAKDIVECLGRQLAVESEPSELVGTSPAMATMRREIEFLARTDGAVLIQGEIGSGKELVARAIHERSARRCQPFIKFDCSDLPHDTIEGELLGNAERRGHAARSRTCAHFEFAGGGTLFLSDIGELSLRAQAKLMRLLRLQRLRSALGRRTADRMPRLVAATRHDLLEQVNAGTFRDDLYHRLLARSVTVPALRERLQDVPRLIVHFAARAARKLGRRVPEVGLAFALRAMEYSWPGNVHELENAIERAVISSSGPMLEADVLLPGLSTLARIERDHILEALEHTRGVIEGTTGAARLLGVEPDILRALMRKLGLVVSASTAAAA